MTAPLLRPGRIVDRYEILRILGRGGLAEVYAARHRELGTLIAIKVLTVGSPRQRERLLQEGRIQAGLRHPNVVSGLDVLRVDGDLALVMELVEGPSLDVALRGMSLSIAQIDSVALDLLSAVRAAHDRGLIHRDLKPGNVLLAPQAEGSVRARVTDFGLAKVLGPSSLALSQTGVAMGTPAYMAPEQFRDAGGVDGRADLYALGVLLYQLLTGVKPFPAGGAFEIYGEIQRQAHAPVAQLRPDAPPRMERAIQAALSFDPDNRPASVAELESLWTDGRPIPRHAWAPADHRQLRLLAPSLEAPPSLESGALQDATACTGPIAFEPLTDPDPSQQTPATIPRHPGQPSRSWAGSLGPLLALLVTAAVGGAAYSSSRSHPDAPAVSAEVSSPMEASVLRSPEPSEPREVRSSTAREASPSPSRTRAPSPPVQRPSTSEERLPRSAPVERAPAPSLAPADGLWSLAGVDRGYALSADGERFQPGPLPPGEYQVYVFFDAAKAVRVLTLRQEDTGPLRVVCDRSMRLCKTR